MYSRFRHKAAPLYLLVLTAMAACESFEGLEVPAGQDERPLADTAPSEPQHPNRFELAYPEQSVIGRLQVVAIEGENTLSDLAREYGLGYDEIVAANPGVDPWLPGIGTRVLLPTQYVLPRERNGIVLNIATRRLFWFPATEPGATPVVYTFPIGIGRVGWETPTGRTTVTAKARDPNWYVPLSVRQEHEAMGDSLPSVVPPGPDNPLGAYVLKLDMPGYLIHGTNQPYGVGMRVSHGCVRLYPENIAFLFPEVAIGATVTIVNEPFLIGERDGELFFEAHKPLEDDTVEPPMRLQTALEQFAASNRIRFPDRAREHIVAIRSYELGVPTRVYTYDETEYVERALAVVNTVAPDPESPTLDEVRDMIDAVMAADEDAAPDDSTAGGIE